MTRFDTDLANKVLEQIEATPDLWDQGFWRNSCGTTFCFAGWVAELEGQWLVPPSLLQRPEAKDFLAVWTSLSTMVLDSASTTYTVRDALADLWEAGAWSPAQEESSSMLDLLLTTGRWSSKEELLAQGISHVAPWAANRLALGDAVSSQMVQELMFDSNLDLDELRGLASYISQMYQP